MAKCRSNKKDLPDKLGVKKSLSVVKKKNPFEIRFIKEKHSVVNRKLKTESGKPGISRAKAIQIRKQTLLQEYKRKNKTNLMLDRRIGEGDSTLSAEDRMIMRFARERKSGNNRFNLGDGDDEEESPLTHLGKSLSQVEKFEDPRSDDDELSDCADNVGAGGKYKKKKKLDAEGHFGGFLTRSDIEFSQGKANSRKEWIEEMIAESKRKRFDRIKIQEESLQMTRDLDDKWKELTVNLKGQIYTKKENEEDDDDKGGYNKLVKELLFQPAKAKAMDRLKTQEEIVKEEKDKLEELEAGRLRRMNGYISDDDDTDDDEEEEGMGTKEMDDEEEESSEEYADDQYSDLEEEEGDEEEVNKKPILKTTNKKVVAVTSGKVELPYTFQIPTSYDELVELFEGRTPSERTTIVERMIKCNHPQLGANNSEQLENLFRFLLQFLHDCGTDTRGDLDSVAGIVPFLYDLCKFSPAPNANAVLNVIREKYSDYALAPKTYPTLESLIFMKLVILLFPASDYRHPVVTPTLQWMSHVLSTAKPTNSKLSITSGLFVSSLMTEAVSLSQRFSPELLNFLCGLVHVSCPDDGKCGKPPSEILLHHVPPFKPVGKESTLFFDLFQSSECRPKRLKLEALLLDNADKRLDEEFAVGALNACLNLLGILADLWKNVPASKDIFSRLALRLLPRLPLDKLHEEVASAVAEVKRKLESIVDVTQKQPLPVMGKDPVKMLRLHEPLIEEHFDPFQKKRSGGDRDKLEMQKLQHKVKREKKAAKKDLRRDASFLAKTKQLEARDMDVDRKRKTRSLMNILGSQEGEYRKFLAGKSKRKK